MSGRNALLGVDLGTQGLKVILVEAAPTRVIGSAGAPVENLTPAPGYLEQEPEKWWASLCQVTRHLLREHNIAPDDIAAIGLSGHMHSIVPLRADGATARDCIVWADTRSQRQAEFIKATAATQLWNPAIAPYSLAKILWLRQHEPGVYHEIDKVLFSKDYLRYRMTGEIATELSDASGSLMWDFAARRWDADLLARLDLPLSLLPRVHGSAEAAGNLTDAAAADLGLSTNALVAFGGGDAACAVIGASLPDRDTLMINTGTAVQVIEIQDKPTPFHPRSAIRYLFELGADGKTFAIGALNSAGHSLNWWRDLINPTMTHAEFEALAATQPSAVDGPLFLPYLQGTGTPFLLDGPYGSFVQLSATADRPGLTRAVMDGVAFGIRLCAEALVGEGKLAQTKILLTGGLPKSKLMREIIGNVMPGEATFRGFSDKSALGAAAHAAVAAGLSEDAAAFLADFDYGELTAAPDAALRSHYEALYQRYKSWALRITGA